MADRIKPINFATSTMDFDAGDTCFVFHIQHRAWVHGRVTRVGKVTLGVLLDDGEEVFVIEASDIRTPEQHAVLNLTV